MYNGYNVYFKIGSEVLTLPITPSEISIKVGSNNKTVSLISGGDINILKSPSLIEVEFTARFPMRKYPYSRDVSSFQTYFDMLEEIKEQKESCRFIVARTTPNGKRTWDTDLLVSIEEFTLNEDAEEGDDVLIDFKLKQYKNYGVKTVSQKKTVKRETESKKSKSQNYVVKKGDCLWTIARRFYGKGSEWRKIYDANKSVIETTAKKYGRKSSSNGWWIYPKTELVIPAK